MSKNLIAHNFQLSIAFPDTPDDYEIIKDMNQCALNINGNVVSWDSYDADGWKKRLATGKDAIFQIQGKYLQGDSTHEKLVGILFDSVDKHNGFKYKLAFPTGSAIKEISGDGVINFNGTNLMGEANDVSALAFEFQSNGKLEVTKSDAK